MDNYCSTQRLTPKIANELVFQIEVLDKLILEIETLEKEWEEYFEINEIKPFTVYYEDLAADFDETLLGVFDFLDFNYDFKAKVLKVDLEKQSDENDEELIVTYRGAKKAEEVYNNMPLAKKHLLGQIVDEELEKTENSPIKQDYQHLLGFDFSPQEAKYRIVCHLAQHLNLDT